MQGWQVDFDDEWEEMPVERVSSADGSELDFDSDEAPLHSRAIPSKDKVRGVQKQVARRGQVRGTGASAVSAMSNTTGAHLDVFDARGYDWRTKPQEEEEEESNAEKSVGYTQLRLDEDEEEEELHAATEYLFQEDLARLGEAGEDPSAAPISQLAMTKRLLSDTQKIAYAGLASLVGHQIVQDTELLELRSKRPASKNASEWLLRVMVRLYQHLDIDPREQTMIDSLAQHGIFPSDIAPSLVATQTIPNPGYISESEPDAGDIGLQKKTPTRPPSPERPASPAEKQATEPPVTPKASTVRTSLPHRTPSNTQPGHQTHRLVTDPNTAAQMVEREAAAEHASSPFHPTSPRAPLQDTPRKQTLDGVTTEISATVKTITLDIRWTVLCDLFLVLIADSVYDARSRVMLERVSESLGLTWMDLTKFEKRITDALEIEEDVQKLNDKDISKRRDLASHRKRMMMMGLATVSGGLVIGLSAGLLAPVIGAGIGTALGTVGISGASAFFSSVGGAAAITTTGTLGGATIGGRGMSRRMRSVKTFEFRPLHNHKRVNCIVTIPGFLRGPEDDPTLPYSVIDPVMGDVFSVMWEPDMMRDMGNAMSILWNETLIQGVQQFLAATVAGAMFSALAWPLWLTKLGYIIDNPWSNAIERARGAGLILADSLMNRQLGVRPVTLVGYSLGARIIFYALRELAQRQAYGIVQNVYLLGAPVSAREAEWQLVRTAVSGRFVNAFSRSDWLLAYLHRAASGGIQSIAGLHPIKYACNVENVDVTHIVPGHLAYRALIPLVLGELGFKTTADYFDEPETLEHIQEREVLFEMEQEAEAERARPKSSWASFFKKMEPGRSSYDATAAKLHEALQGMSAAVEEDDALPPREEAAKDASNENTEHGPPPSMDTKTLPATPNRDAKEGAVDVESSAAQNYTGPAQEDVDSRVALEDSGAALNDPVPSAANADPENQLADKSPPSPPSPPYDNALFIAGQGENYGLSSEEAQQLAAQFAGLTADTAPGTPKAAALENPWD
ncbi:hypothetical protein MVES1_003077 [Malassezia vespertilionis]|uniref:DUF726-domain-containing protein n=1 Tax=Malassezia vespertilionis TaxID=2020962 RepID=A0A2N1J974_9BASI|nr:uncharacterized protein MVES1_003077 [Malassezia vespertilionis]PKI83109.1 hypothetical protein MVES_002917 [Malassezia vespertilionis]WFD07707.1 hypothetical protein MVES1_003077 [Malassezia vespertilionis]